MTTWAPGTSIGPYTLLSRAGAGGMGEVWKARDTRLGRTVAIKKLKTEHAERFSKEARAIAALNHPNICQLYDIGPDYLVMEYIEGRILQGPVPVEVALGLAIQITAALDEAHRRGILHRDLKPGNIMVSANGVAKLLDFGLARPMTDSDLTFAATAEGTIVGTAAYMAPEQAEGQPLDARSDIFSLGAVLYELLSGRRAFDGGSTAQILSAVLRDDPRPLQTQEELDRIIVRCLAKQPGQRFQTMAELKAGLEKVPIKSTVPEASIAVLPFANMSGDKENEYFSDGVTEEIINVLAHIPGLKVTARTSAFAFRGKDQDIRRTAETLGVRTVLEGSVRRAGNRVRVTAQLINAADGYHLWSERYDREMADVFEMQDEIAGAIAGALKIQLAIKSTGVRRYKPNLPAYEALLKGRHYGIQGTVESFTRSRECFERAIALDPQFALAQSEAGMYLVIGAIQSMLPAHEAMPAVRSHAQKALDIDPSLPEAHAVLGVVAAVYDYDWKEAERQFRLALAQDPISPEVRILHAGYYLIPTARFDEAEAELRRALLEDPLNVTGRIHLPVCLTAAGKADEAEREGRQAVELNPGFGIAWWILGFVLAVQGRFEEALPFIEKAHVLVPFLPAGIGMLAALRERRGESDQARKLLEKLGDGQAYSMAGGFIMFHFFNGEIDKIGDWIEKIIQQRVPVAPGLLRGPTGQSLRSGPRWKELAGMMNFPEARSGL